MKRTRLRREKATGATAASLGFGIERIGIAALSFPGAATTLLAATLIVAALGIPQLRFADNLQNVFESGAPEDVAYRALARDFAVGEAEFLLLAETQSFAEPRALETLRRAHFEAQLLDGVGSVISAFSLREAPTGGTPPPTILRPDLAADAIVPAFARIDRHPLNLGKLLSADRSRALIAVRPDAAASSLAGQIRLADELRAVMAEVTAGTGVRITATGIPILRIEIVQRLIRDSVLLNALGAMIVTAIGWAVFQSFRLTLITVLPPLLAAAATLGAMGIVGVRINAMTIVIPVLILVTVFADSMHLTFAWLRGRAARASPRAAVAAAIAHVGPACVLATATTMIAFAAIAVSETIVVREFGLTGFAAMFLALCLLLLAHPLLCLALGDAASVSGTRRGIGAIFSAMAEASRRLVGARPRTIVAVALALFALSAAAHYNLAPDYTIREHLPDDDPANAALERIDRHLQGAFAVQIPVPLAAGGDALSPAALSAVRSVHVAVKAAQPQAEVLSVWSLAEWLGAADPEDAARRIRPLWDDIGARSQRGMISRDGSHAVVTTWLREMPAAETDRAVTGIEAEIARTGAPLRATGLVVHSARKSQIILNELKGSLLVAVVLAIALIAAAFRAPAVGLVSLLPNILPILVTGSYLYVAGHGLQFASALALTIAFGIAVNDTIHFLNRYRYERAQPAARALAVSRAIHTVGPILIATTAVLCAGLAATLASSLPMTALFGALCAILLLTALVADLIFLPSLILILPRRWADTL